MNFTLCAGLILFLMSEVVASQAFLKQSSLSYPVLTYNHRQLHASRSKRSRSKQFTLQALYPVVCYVRETLDAFQQISETSSKVREPVS